MSYKNILVCTDYSDKSLAAFKYVGNLAEKTNAKIGLAHVSESFDDESVIFNNNEAVADGKTYKQLVTDNLNSQMDLFIEKTAVDQSSVKKHISFGNIKNHLIEIIEKGNYDLLVVGQHGHNFITELLLGSVTEKMLKASPIDILVIKSDNEEIPNSIHSSVDFTKLSESVIAKTKSLAKDLNANVTLSHLVELNPKAYIGVSELDGVNATNSIQQIIDQEVQISNDKLESLAKTFDQSVNVTCKVVAAKDFRIAENILEYEADLSHDLTIVGAHGKGIIERFLFGSTAQRIVEQSKSNILVIKK